MTETENKSPKENNFPTMRYLIIGAGSMGSLHASYLLNNRMDSFDTNTDTDIEPGSKSAQRTQINIEVALLDRPGIPLNQPFGYIPIQSNNETNENDNLVKSLHAKIVDIKGAKQFLSECMKRHNKIKRGVLSCVKVYDIQKAFEPLQNEIQKYVSIIILLHNGLRYLETDTYLSSTFLTNHNNYIPLYNMVTCAGGTLLTKNELEIIHERFGVNYLTVVRATGPGPAFIYPVSQTNNDSDIIELENSSLVNVAVAMIPNCKLLSSNEGHCEQIMKLCINVALNGLLARRALKDWYKEYIISIEQQNNDTTSIKNISEKRLDPSPQLVHRVINYEIENEISLACAIARLVSKRACLAEPTNLLLQTANNEDHAAIRTHETFTKVPNNVCSTVVDICAHRKTESEALFHAVQEWPRLVDEASNDDNDNGISCLECVCESCLKGNPCTRAASLALDELTTMLKAWDKYIMMKT